MKKLRCAVILVGVAMVLLLAAAKWISARFAEADAMAMHSCVESLASGLQFAVQTNSTVLRDRLRAAPQRIDEQLLAELAKVGSLDCASMSVNAAGDLCDAWGSEILIEMSSTAEGAATVRVISVGPDKKQGTRDDIQASRSFPH
jgi:hypothetical protein